MTILALSRQHPKKTALSGFLAVLFLAQALLLPWLTAPQLVSANGQWVMMCTLQGLQRVHVNSGDPVPLSGKGNHCPACTLAHFSNIPLPTIKLATLPSQWRYTGKLVAVDKVATFWFDQTGHAIRAPPAA